MKPNVEGQNVYEDIEFLRRMDSEHRPIIISPDQERRFLKDGYLRKVEGRFEMTPKLMLCWPGRLKSHEASLAPFADLLDCPPRVEASRPPSVTRFTLLGANHPAPD